MEKLKTVTKKILQKYAERIPDSLMGVERQVFIGNKLVAGLPENEKLALHKFVQQLLIEMREKDASDIDFGGWGSNGFVWLRIQGNKKNLPDFGKFTIDEFDLLVQSILMDSQRDVLYEDRNHDFSYTFRVGNQMMRYRANVYFDMDICEELLGGYFETGSSFYNFNEIDWIFSTFIEL